MSRILKILGIVILLYIGYCSMLALFQEQFIFYPEKLHKNHVFNTKEKIEEIYINTKDGDKIHGLLFKVDSSKGLIFYLHGNSGSLRTWRGVANTYTKLNYDIFILDYKGFGKSEGSITSEQQLINDTQAAYDKLTQDYPEKDIVVIGYSIGTALAAGLSATNNPKMLILQAPFYCLTEMMKATYPIIPTFLLKYKFPTHDYIEDCKMPVVLFLGKQDRIIDYKSSIKLKEHLKAGDQLITLTNQGHNGMTDNPAYVERLKLILN